MKKLMFAAALATVGVAFAIESSNIVGYSQQKLRSGVELSTPQFVSISTEGVELDSLQPTGSDVVDNLYIDILDYSGAPSASYYWTNIGGEECWSEDFVKKASGVTFQVGEGFSVTALEGQSLQSAGQVGKDDVVYELSGGVNIVGNPFPVKLSLADVLPGGEDVIDNLYIDVFDYSGAPAASYYWTNIGGKECWTEDFVTEVTNVEFVAGQGFSVTALNGQTITIAAPEF